MPTRLRRTKMKLNGYPERRLHPFRCSLASLATITTLGLLTARPGISGALKVERLRRLTLSLLALAFLAATIVAGPSVRAREEPQKQFISLSLNSQAGLAFRQQLLDTSSIPGTSSTAEAQATVDVRAFHQRIQGTIGATSNNAVINQDDRSVVTTTDNPPPDPTVVVLPTPLGLQSSTDIPDFSIAASDQFILNANSSTIYFQDDFSNILASSSLPTFFSGLSPSNPFGPKVYYDEMAERFVIAAIDNFGTSQSSVLLGVSQTPDPTMNWSLYKFGTDSQGQTSAGALSSFGGN